MEHVVVDYSDVDYQESISFLNLYFVIFLNSGFLLSVVEIIRVG